MDQQNRYIRATLADDATSDTIRLLEDPVMTRRWMLFLLLLAAASFLSARSAAAQAISPDNPYRGYNISGVNYASMQWERSHSRKSSTKNRTSRNFVRRGNHSASW